MGPDWQNKSTIGQRPQGGYWRRSGHALLALVGAAVLALGGCREAPPAEQPLPEPVRDPTWHDPAQQEIDLPAASTTTLPQEAAPVPLPPAATSAEPPEPLGQVMASVAPQALEAFGLIAELPQPVTAVAAGMGAAESWVYIRTVRGSAYNLELRVSQQSITSLAQLRAAAEEIGELPLLGSGTSGGRWWVQKAVEGPVQEWWVALPPKAAPAPLPVPVPASAKAGEPTPARAVAPPPTLVAVCVGPAAYEQVLRRACLTLHLDGDVAPPPWDATLTTEP